MYDTTLEQTMKRRRRDYVMDDPYWRELAVYNAEVRRGIVHTPAWAERMKTKQVYWDGRHGGPYAPDEGFA